MSFHLVKKIILVLLLQLVILLIPQAMAPSLNDQNYSSLVEGVDKVVSPGFPGGLLGIDPGWVAIVGGDDDTSMPSCFILARKFSYGRVIAIGHEGLLTNLSLLDNKRLMDNLIGWLSNKSFKSVRYTTGHREWLGAWNLGELELELKAQGYFFNPIPKPITLYSLNQAGVLIVGNAWASFTETEVALVQSFVESGGGLLLVGTGWSWPGKLEDYPMVVMARPYKLMWLRNVIADSTDQLNNSPVFSTFFPEASAGTIEGAMSDILAALAIFPSSLHLVLEADPELHRTYCHAHLLLSQIPLTFPGGSFERTFLFDFYRDLISDTLGVSGFNYLKKSRIYNSSQAKTMTFLRELFFRTWIESEDLTSVVKFEIPNLSNFPQLYRNLFSFSGVYLMDDTSLNDGQLKVIDTILRLVPQELHNLAFISVLDLLGSEFPPGISAASFGVCNRGSINISGIDIGIGENSFPSDVSPGLVDVFTIIVAHELNHVVDAFNINRNPFLLKRKNRLIEAAGSDHMNYLQSKFPDGFFLKAPQEFFASISNLWFTDSAKTLELGLHRFDGGRPQPLNQTLFFADVYSCGRASTYFYLSDTKGNIKRTVVPISRDQKGHINRLTFNKTCYNFELDSAGNVLTYTTAPEAVLANEIKIKNIRPKSSVIQNLNQKNSSQNANFKW